MQNIGKIGEYDVRITWHALQRMVDMKLTVETIKDLILDPDEVYESRKYPGNTCHRRGDYSLAYLWDGPYMVVKTVLYGTQSSWLKANKAGALSADRVLDMERLKGLPRY